MSQAEEQAQRIEILLREQKGATEKVQREYNSQTQRMEKLQRELDEQNLSDMLCDLGHYCDRQKISLQERLRVASYHYIEETDRKGAQFTPVSNPLDDASNLATVLVALRLFQRTYEGCEAKDI